MNLWWAEHALLPTGPAAQVLIETTGERITTVRPGVPPPSEATRLAGLTMPGLANAHSHAFHRALRARTQAGRGTFWTWREQMYKVADRLTPERYHSLARAVYAEMALAGITCVGEFHYLHHGPGGTPYARSTTMAEALVAAADEAGIRITLLDTCYLTGGLGQPLAGPQLRFGDGNADRWASRAGELAAALRERPNARCGAALHSVRAVPRDRMNTVVAWADEHAAPLHVHLSEQRAENEACLSEYGATPTQILAEAGALTPRTSVVHATHLTDRDIALIGAARASTCMCPTTERDLADGIGRAVELNGAGSPITLGSDSHAVIDLFEEARGVELNERLRTEERGHWAAADLLRTATANGHAALGWADAGRLAERGLADFVTIAVDTPRLAGFRSATAAESVVFAAIAADVRHVVVGGRFVVRDFTHLLVPEVPRALDHAITDVTG
ncbi:formimidoylglutamate deiminase [Dactylosporangium sucinum]|uniref:formimidoylglutamate deiminase n=1 Tax=Dactylosporangium sucinum TaxID=1424081 RepID=UPI00167D7E59|nr:formimidoylglutamate deiminase [Dactylosporangium sucinum]